MAHDVIEVDTAKMSLIDIARIIKSSYGREMEAVYLSFGTDRRGQELAQRIAGIDEQDKMPDPLDCSLPLAPLALGALSKRRAPHGTFSYEHVALRMCGEETGEYEFYLKYTFARPRKARR